MKLALYPVVSFGNSPHTFSAAVLFCLKQPCAAQDRRISHSAAVSGQFAMDPELSGTSLKCWKRNKVPDGGAEVKTQGPDEPARSSNPFLEEEGKKKSVNRLI